MRRNIFFSVILLLLSTAMKAMPVDANQALITAQKFCAKAVTNNIMRKAPASAKMTLAYTARTKQGNNNSFYVFNRGAENGFVIVSAEDRAEEVIGYTDKGDFDYTSIPANMKAWLDQYSRQIDFIIAHPGIEKAAQRKAINKSVEPLLGEIKWDQLEPYNDKCPIYNDGISAGKSATGCVATAMGQVMYCNRWPEKGTGTHSYVDEGSGGTHSVDFGSTTYKWDDMLPSLTTSSPNAAKDAVSTLLYHVGVSVNMQYGSSSGAYSTDIAPALINYFGYDKGIRYIVRNYYTTSEWEGLLRNSLDNSHPAVYNGTTQDKEGHSFVCDGYNSEGYFHINWGWSGDSNGYFLLSVLDPDEQGTGGSTGELAFNYNQDMVINIQKAKEGSEVFYEMCCEQLAETNIKEKRTKPVTLEAKDVYSNTLGYAVVSFDYALVDKDSQVVARTTSPADSIEFNYGEDVLDRSLQIPDTLKEGTYKAYLIFNKKDSKIDNKVRILQGRSQYFTVVVTSDSVFVKDAGKPDLTITKLTFNPDPIEANKPSTITAKIKCNGPEFSGYIYYYIRGEVDKYSNAYSEKKRVSIKSNEEAEVTFTQTFDLPEDDTYRLAFYISNSEGGNSDTKILPDTLITIKGGTRKPNIYLYESAYFENHETSVPKNNIVFYVPIQNDGGDYNGQIVATITDGSYSVKDFDTLDISIPAGTKQVLTFKGNYLEGEVGHKYSTALIDLNQEYGWLYPSDYAYIDFTLADAVSDAINNAVTDNSVKISMRDGMINIATANKLMSAEVYSASGKMINKSMFSNSVSMNNTPSGTYLVVVKTDKGVMTKKIMK